MLALRVPSAAVAAYNRVRQPSRCLVTVRAQAEPAKKPKQEKITKGDLVSPGIGAGERQGARKAANGAIGSRAR